MKRSIVCLLFLAFVACDDPNRIEAPEDRVWTDLAVGTDHACATASDGNVYCWGSNDRGQLSIPNGGPVSVAPSLALIGLQPRQLVAGSGYSCAVEPNGLATCWGDGRIGQLGTGVQLQSSIGQRARGGPWDDLSAGAYHACGISNGDLQCWGGDRYGASFGFELPVQSRCTDPVSEEMWWCALDAESVEAPEPIVSVEAGLWQTCGLSGSGNVYCWGMNALSQLGFEPTEQCRIIDPVHGDGLFPCAFAPRQVALPGPARQVVPGASHTCAVLDNGDAYCWGSWISSVDQSGLYAGQLGWGGSEGSATPVKVAVPGSMASVSANRQTIWTSSCGLTTDGQAYCWGSNRDGQLGAASTDECTLGGSTDPCAFTPVAVDTDARFTKLGVGERFTCGLTNDGQVMCWGLNDEGQLGDGTLDSRSEPRSVLTVTTQG